MDHRTCTGCSATLLSGHRERNPRRWCSERCRIRHRRTTNADYAERERLANIERARLQRRAAPITTRFATCPQCAEGFISPRKRIYCSKRCGQLANQAARNADGRNAKVRDRRRARKLQAFVADVDRFEVFERDGWTCQLCGDPVDRQLVHPDPGSPQLDHVVPLALGGTHEPANCQLAHFRCNAQKGSRWASPPVPGSRQAA